METIVIKQQLDLCKTIYWNKTNRMQELVIQYPLVQNIDVTGTWMYEENNHYTHQREYALWKKPTTVVVWCPGNSSATLPPHYQKVTGSILGGNTNIIFLWWFVPIRSQTALTVCFWRGNVKMVFKLIY